MVVRDLPGAVLQAPHVGEARLHWRAIAALPQVKRVHARVQVRAAVFVDLDTFVRDGPEGVLGNKRREVALRALEVAYVRRRDGRKEGEVPGRVHAGHGGGVLGLQRVIPRLEVGLPRSSKQCVSWRPSLAMIRPAARDARCEQASRTVAME